MVSLTSTLLCVSFSPLPRAVLTSSTGRFHLTPPPIAIYPTATSRSATSRLTTNFRAYDLSNARIRQCSSRQELPTTRNEGGVAGIESGHSGEKGLVRQLGLGRKRVYVSRPLLHSGYDADVVTIQSSMGGITLPSLLPTHGRSSRRKISMLPMLEVVYDLQIPPSELLN